MPVMDSVNMSPNSVLQGELTNINAQATDAVYTVTQAEYYIDTDPGEGSGVAMSITDLDPIWQFSAFGINTSGLSGGIHTFFVRAYSAEEGWSEVLGDDLEVVAVTRASGGGGLCGVGRMLGG